MPTISLGYALSSELHTPRELIDNAVKAERAGFDFGSISDHYHPWLDVQGQSGFVWSTLGGIAASTNRMSVGTGVTCPMVRIHPAIIAQAAATTASLFGNRFFLGVGTGENLNEHVLGTYWPPDTVRREMLAEAVDVIRSLWRGDLYSHRGEHYTVENARIYTLPTTAPPIYVAASGVESASLAGKIGDGLISTAPDKELVEAFQAEGNRGPRYAQIGVCCAPSEEQALEAALKYWPTTVVPGAVKAELALPAEFESLSAMVTKDAMAGKIVLGMDAAKHLEGIQRFIDAGFDHIFIHQIVPEQDSFFELYKEKILPRFVE